MDAFQAMDLGDPSNLPPSLARLGRLPERENRTKTIPIGIFGSGDSKLNLDLLAEDLSWEGR